MRAKAFAILAACAFLAGCGPSRQEMLNAAHGDCTAYGMVSGSPEYSQCMMARDGQYQAAEMQRRQNIQAGLANMQRSMQAQEPVRMAPRTCTSRPMGNTVITDCQ